MQLSVLSREQSDRQAQMVMVADYSCGADVILAREPIRTVRDLKGKRVAIETGTLTAFVLARALEMANLRWEDVTTCHYAALDMPGAYARNEFDVVVTYSPPSIEIARQANTVEIFSSRDLPGEIVDVLAFDDVVISSRRHDIQAFVRAFHRAQDYAQAHPQEAYQIMAARQRISPSEFRALLEDGICLVDRTQQQDYLGIHGSLPSTVATTSSVLTMLQQISQTTSHTNAISPVCLE